MDRRDVSRTVNRDRVIPHDGRNAHGHMMHHDWPIVPHGRLFLNINPLANTEH